MVGHLNRTTGRIISGVDDGPKNPRTSRWEVLIENLSVRIFWWALPGKNVPMRTSSVRTSPMNSQWRSSMLLHRISSYEVSWYKSNISESLVSTKPKISLSSTRPSEGILDSRRQALSQRTARMINENLENNLIQLKYNWNGQLLKVFLWNIFTRIAHSELAMNKLKIHLLSFVTGKLASSCRRIASRFRSPGYDIFRHFKVSS